MEKKCLGWLGCFFIVGCGAMNVDEPGYEFEGKADQAASLRFQAGTLVAPGLGSQQNGLNGLSESAWNNLPFWGEENFSQGVYRWHNWIIRKSAGDVISMELETFATFEPVIQISYLPQAYGSASGCTIYLDAQHGLEPAGDGRWRFTMVTNNFNWEFHLAVSSRAALTSDPDATVDPRARYSLRMLPMAGGELAGELTASLDDQEEKHLSEASSTLDLGLEYRNQALVRFTPDQGAMYVAKAQLSVSTSTGFPELPLTYMGHQVTAEEPSWPSEQKGIRTHQWGVAQTLDQVTWTIGEDNDMDLLWEDATIAGVKVWGIDEASLLESNAQDLRVCPTTGSWPVPFN